MIPHAKDLPKKEVKDTKQYKDLKIKVGEWIETLNASGFTELKLSFHNYPMYAVNMLGKINEKIYNFSGKVGNTLPYLRLLRDELEDKEYVVEVDKSDVDFYIKW